MDKRFALTYNLITPAQLFELLFQALPQIGIGGGLRHEVVADLAGFRELRGRELAADSELDAATPGQLVTQTTGTRVATPSSARMRPWRAATWGRTSPARTAGACTTA